MDATTQTNRETTPLLTENNQQLPTKEGKRAMRFAACLAAVTSQVVGGVPSIVSGYIISSMQPTAANLSVAIILGSVGSLFHCLGILSLFSICLI